MSLAAVITKQHFVRLAHATQVPPVCRAGGPAYSPKRFSTTGRPNAEKRAGSPLALMTRSETWGLKRSITARIGGRERQQTFVAAADAARPAACQ